MQTPTLKSNASPQAQSSDRNVKPEKKCQTKMTTNEQTTRLHHSDTRKAANIIFGETATLQNENGRMNTKFTKIGSQHISATSLMSRATEKLVISLPADRVNGGWKAKISSRENGQSTKNLAAVRSDETGKWTIMPDKMEAAGQIFSHTRRYTKSVDNPVQGPYTASQGAEIATKMLKNIGHLNGKDLVQAGSSFRRGGEVSSAETVMDAIKMTKGIPGQVFVYKVSGEPAALMKGKMRYNDIYNSFHVNFIVSDPYAREAGTALIEKAVNLSFQNGGDGTVTLEATTSGAVNQYKKLGFSPYSPFSPSMFASDLKLDPNRSDQWEKVGDQYTYVGARAQKYITEFGRP